MSKRMIGILVLSCVVFSLLFAGCAVPSGGCPYCGYPPGVVIDGDDVTCQRCGGGYRVYLDGSVRTNHRPTQQYQTPVPTNNTDATQQNINQTGLILLEGLK